jgi:hypothetical protein
MKPPLPNPLLHKCVEVREESEIVHKVRCAQFQIFGDHYSIPKRFWICSSDTPLVSGMTRSTHSNCPTMHKA